MLDTIKKVRYNKNENDNHYYFNEKHGGVRCTFLNKEKPFFNI